jgi:hypothetical protein
MAWPWPIPTANLFLPVYLNIGTIVHTPLLPGAEVKKGEVVTPLRVRFHG